MRIQFICRCFLLLTLLNQAQAMEPVLIVTEDLPPLQIVKDGHIFDGLAYHKVKRLVETAKLDATWLVAPWARAYKIALTRPNVLLFSLVRTPQREAKFTWIGQIYLMDLFLVSLKSHGITVNSLEQAQDLLVGSKRNDVVFDFLQSAGFTTDKNIVVVNDTTATFDALLKSRVDLVPANKVILEAYCAHKKCSLQDFNFNIHLPQMEQDFYLAVSKGTDPKVIKALRDAYRYVEMTYAQEAIEAVESANWNLLCAYTRYPMQGARCSTRGAR